MNAAFHIGQVVEHLKVSYRGVVYGVDAVFSLDDEWYEQVARSRPPKDKPWYHVLVHGCEHTTYVAERHLQAAAEPAQIEHPMLGRYFERFDGARYFPKAPN
jgi:heat shock protein HspQ